MIKEINTPLLSTSVKGLQECFSFQSKYNKFKKKRIFFVSDSSVIIREIKNLWKEFSLKYAYFFNLRKFKFSEIDSGMVVIVHIKPIKDFLLNLNKYCLKNNIKFVKGAFTGSEFILVPFLLPGEGACYNCYTILKSYNFIYDQDTVTEGYYILIKSYPRPWLKYALFFLTLKLVDWTTRDIYLQDEISEYILNLKQMTISQSPLLRSPICPSCKVLEDE